MKNEIIASPELDYLQQINEERKFDDLMFILFQDTGKKEKNMK